MILWMLGILSIIALASGRVNMWALTIFTIPSLLFYSVGEYVEESHYLFAAVIDILIICGLTKIFRPTKLVAFLAIASLLSILINFVGWIMYMNYLDPAAYELAGVVLYAVVIVLTLWDGVNGNANDNCKHLGVHRFYTFGHHFSAKDHKA